MMSWFILFCYIWFAYGMSVIVTQGVGPFEIFLKLREWTDSLSDNLGLLFRCMMCFPTNLGIVFSLINWFFIPIAITPFNMILGGYEDLWFIACFMDGCLTGGICHLLWNIDDYIDKITPIYED